MIKRKFICAVIASMLLSTALTGCTGNKTSNQTQKDAPVNLTFYYQNSPVNDSDRIMGKANKIIEKSINAHLNLVAIDGASYAQKMNLMINSGDPWDLCFTAFWGGINFSQNAANGAYADLTDLMPKYAPQSYSRIPQGLWNGVKVNGKICAVVNYQQWGAAARKGFEFRKDIADEVGFDWKAVKGKSTIDALNLIGPFLGSALKKHPDMIGWETSSSYSFFANEPMMWDMEAVGDMTTPGWVKFAAPNKVINQFETPEFAQYCDIMRDWYQKGYVRKDGATLKDTSPDRKASKIVAEKAYSWPDTLDSAAANGGKIEVDKMSMSTIDKAPAVGVSTTRTIIPAGAGSNAAIAINSKSKNTVKALQLIELLNTNNDLYKLINYGEEGVDYQYTSDGTMKQIDGKYNFNWNDWQIGQSYSPDFTRALYDKNAHGDKAKNNQKVVFAADKTAELSPVTGFTFDATPVKTQLANCNSVFTEMVPALSNGCVDPKKVLPEFLSRLKAAGVDDVIKEKQKQLDAWNASKK
jgi:putative aldouronate transport system substrate-binding protein